MYGFLRQPRWIFLTVLMVGVIPAFLVLASWQWGRANEQAGEDAVTSANLATPSAPVERVLSTTTPLAPTASLLMVTARGRYDPSGQVLVRQRPAPDTNDGRLGFWVLTPLRTDLGDVLWVNRGWVLAGTNARQSPPVPAPPAGTVTIEGRVLPPEPGKANAADLPAGQVNRIVPAQFPAPLDGGGTYQGYVDLVSSDPPEASGLVLVGAAPDVTVSQGRHISYAVQWVLFAVVAVVGWGLLVRREAHEEAEVRAQRVR